MFQKNKYLIVFILLLSLALGFLYFNSSQKTYADELNKSIKEIIDEKQDDHNYMKDSYFLSKIDELISIIYKDNIENIVYSYGNLDDSNIPEIVVFTKRDPIDPTDEGSLSVYKYIHDRYTLVDKITMNYDNENYDLVIGKISSDKNGLYLSNQVGAHSGVTYGFILENNRLKSILNPNKLNLLSVYAENEIKDINNDGKLNFSIYTIDPESEDKSLKDSDKILLWYEWDNNDSANLVAIEKNGKFESDNNNVYLLTEGFNHLDTDYSKFLSFLNDNIDNFSKIQVSKLLDSYIQVLENNIFINNSILEEKLNRNNIAVKLDLIDTFNSIEKIDLSRMLEDKEDLKDFLKLNLLKGYYFDKNKGDLKYSVDYEFFNKEYKEYISSEFKDFLDINSITQTYQSNNQEDIKNLIEKAIKIENYKNIYPYSKYIDNLTSLYVQDLNFLFFGNENVKVTNQDGKIKKELLNIFISYKDEYKNTYLASLMDYYVHILMENDLILDKQIIDSLTNKYM